MYEALKLAEARARSLNESFFKKSKEIWSKIVTNHRVVKWSATVSSEQRLGDGLFQPGEMA
jgi:hypothetical protein